MRTSRHCPSEGSVHTGSPLLKYTKLSSGLQNAGRSITDRMKKTVRSTRIAPPTETIVRIKVLRYNRNLSVYQNIKRTFKAWLPPCPPVFYAALHRVCIFLSDSAKVVKIPKFSKCGKFCGSKLDFALSLRPIVPVIGSARLKNRAFDGGSRTFACIAFSAPSKGTNVPAIHRLKAGRTGTVRFLS